MKKHIFLVGLVILAIISQITPTSVVLAAEQPQMVGTKIESVDSGLTNKQIIKNLVDKYSEMYGVSSTSLMSTISNEDGTFDFDIQSGLHYKAGNRWGFPAGTREKSYGIAQIHLPDHPDVTIAEATDPEFAVEFMAKAFANGKAGMWMGFKG